MNELAELVDVKTFEQPDGSLSVIVAGGFALVSGTSSQSLSFVGDRIILKKMKAYLLEMIDTQGGRLRFDFAERLDRGKLDFRWEMFQRLEATVKGISSAIEKGMSRKEKGEQAVGERRAVLSETEDRMNEIRKRLIEIQQQVSA